VRWRGMKNPPFQHSAISIARRGQIIQRVIVDGWTSAAVSAAFGVPERLVDVWVADFRRRGMASLQSDFGQSIAAEIIQVAVARPVRTFWRWISIGLRRFSAIDPLVQPLPLRRSNEDGPR
jgi:hypothetical protein